ncbi:MAG: methylmalonyl Co-A mutase-associated GTPase MeaB [Dehalococcoidales bacterium]|nr:methylmalonyl Co-A mutase-associated GTPase MeaB [Dehalococcoidales bacterium]
METGIAQKVLAGDVLAASRLMRGLEDEDANAIEQLKTLYPHTGKAYIVGVTGSPGAGKSSIIGCLIGIFRRRGLKVGVVAIDPTSPFTHGAILGDRIRMQQYNIDNDVFIRSLATRGWSGGLSKATISTIHVMDAMGKDIILVETVGAGQAEVDIVRVADTAIVVLTPGMGDEIQMMKAGIMEIADIFVVNKADIAGAEELKEELKVMISMKPHLPGQWQPSVALTEAVCDRGTEELATEILKHKEFLGTSGDMTEKRRARAKLELIDAIESSLMNYIYRNIDKGDYLEGLIEDLTRRATDPYSAAQRIITQLSQQLEPGYDAVTNSSGKPADRNK